MSNATNILGTKFDESTNPVCNKGQLDPSVTAANCTKFVDFLDYEQLRRFGMLNCMLPNFECPSIIFFYVCRHHYNIRR